ISSNRSCKSGVCESIVEHGDNVRQAGPWTQQSCAHRCNVWLPQGTIYINSLTGSGAATARNIWYGSYGLSSRTSATGPIEPSWEEKRHVSEVGCTAARDGLAQRLRRGAEWAECVGAAGGRQAYGPLPGR